LGLGEAAPAPYVVAAFVRHHGNRSFFMASPSYHETAAPGAAGSLSPVALAAMAFACGGAVANIYYVQPILGVIGDEFSRAATLVSLLPTANQLGFAIGLLLLVPLGDGMSRQGLIFGQLAWLAASLAAAALAPGPGTLFAAMVAVGIGATVAQQIVPLAAELAPPARRGAARANGAAGCCFRSPRRRSCCSRRSRFGHGRRFCSTGRRRATCFCCPCSAARSRDACGRANAGSGSGLRSRPV
jgi:MFS family permease